MSDKAINVSIENDAMPIDETNTEADTEDLATQAEVKHLHKGKMALHKKKRKLPHYRLKFSNKEVPRLTWKSVAVLLTITIIYSVLAFVNIGTDRIPETRIAIDKENPYLIIELDKETCISSLCFYKWQGFSDEATLEVKLHEDDNWDVCYGPKEIAKQMRWHTIDITEETPIRYLRLSFEGEEVTLAEIVVFDSAGNKVPFSCPEDMNSHLTEHKNLDVLCDEQELYKDSSTTAAYFDEFLYALTAYSYKNGGSGCENTHPALGKVLMAIGISLFGMRPLGWRFFGIVAGILMLPTMFFLSRRILKSNKWANVATFLMAIECMHCSQTRMATIDSFPLLFILLAYLFMLKYFQENRNKEYKNLLLSGICFGLACSFKWIGIYSGVGLAICFFAFFVSKNRFYKEILENFDTKEYLIRTFLWCVLSFVLVPLAVYTATYLPVAFGPYEDIQGWSGIWENQKYMLNFHSNLSDSFYFSSKWWEWPFCLGTFAMFSVRTGESTGQAIFCMGNPVIWIASIPAIVFLIFSYIKRRRTVSKENESNKELADLSEKCKVIPIEINEGLVLTIIAFLAQYVPWMLIQRECFIYHYFASVEISIIAITEILRRLNEKGRKKTVVLYIIVASLTFSFLYPVISGIDVPVVYLGFLRILTRSV